MNKRQIPRVLLGLLAVLALALAVSACGSDNNDSSSASGQGSATTKAPATTSGGTSAPDDPANLTDAQKAANQIKPIAGADKISLKMGSKNFPEQYVLGEIYTQGLQAAGYKVKKDLNLGSEVVAHKSLTQGEIDAYPEYTGTALTSFFKVNVQDVPKDPAKAFQDAKAAYAKENITAFDPTPFENTYRIAMTKKTAAKLGNPTKISQLAGKSDKLVINGYPECRQRIDCLLGVKKSYGLKFKKFLPGQNNYQLLDNGNADLAFVFTTDGPLASGKYQILDDDKSIFPPYNVTLSMRNDKATALGAAGKAVIASLQRNLTQDVMQELNAKVSVDKEEPAAAAKSYLTQFGYTK